MDEATAEPIDLTDVRAYLCMEPDDTAEDAALTEAISYCRDRLEAYLPYYLAEREVRVERPMRGAPHDLTMELTGPVLELHAVEVVLADGSRVRVPNQLRWCFADVLHVDVAHALRGVRARAPPMGVSCEYRAGAHVPPIVKNALLMMVRNRYERRDEDPLTEAVAASLYAETRPNI